MSKYLDVARKFYSSEEERLRKIKEKKGVIEAVSKALTEVVIDLYYDKKLRLFIFESMEDGPTPCLHAGLIGCCGDERTPTSKERKAVENAILEKTHYKKVIWEL